MLLSHPEEIKRTVVLLSKIYVTSTNPLTRIKARIVHIVVRVHIFSFMCPGSVII